MSNLFQSLTQRYKLIIKRESCTNTETWLAQDLRKTSYELVFVKLIRSVPRYDSHPKLNKKCRRLIRFSHPLYVPLLDYGYDKSYRCYYFVYEQSDETPLKQNLAGIAPNEILEILQKLSNFLSCLHSTGITHGSLSIYNILYHEKTKSLIICDTGWADLMTLVKGQNRFRHKSYSGKYDRDIDSFKQIVRTLLSQNNQPNLVCFVMWEEYLNKHWGSLENFEVKYKSWKEAENFEVKLDEDGQRLEELREFLSGERYIISRKSTKRGHLQVIGYLQELKDNALVIWLNHQVNLSDLKKTGKLQIGINSEAKIDLKRKLEAFEKFNSSKSVMPNLCEIIVQPKMVQIEPLPESEIEWIQRDYALDPSQKKAICYALATPDFFLIQGPPGTGKTSVISELVLQILQREPNARILISSQSNVAVDNALNKILELYKKSPGELPRLKARTIRVGREEKVNATEQALMIEPQLAKWRQSVIEESGNYVTELKSKTSGQKRLLNTITYLSEGQKLIKLKNQCVEDVVRKHIQMQIEDRIRRINHFLLSEHGQTFCTLQEQQSFIEQSYANAHQDILRLGRIRQIAEEWQGRVDNNEGGLSSTYLDYCNLIGATCMSVARQEISGIKFDWVIVDEAGRATHPEMLVPLVRGCKLILVGDHRQLPPTISPEQEEEEILTKMVGGEGKFQSILVKKLKKEFSRSLFQELIEKGKNSVSVLLNRQYRMHPGIGTLISQCFYEGKLKNGRDEGEFDRCWAWRPVIWCSTRKLPSHDDIDNSSNNEGKYDNPTEVEVIIKLLDKLDATHIKYNGKKPVEIGIITGYKEQKKALELKIEANKSKWKEFEIEINTVDAYQGREQDIIIYSVVRSNRKRKLGFLRKKAECSSLPRS